MTLGQAVKLPEGWDRWFPTLQLSYGTVPVVTSPQVRIPPILITPIVPS